MRSALAGPVTPLLGSLGLHGGVLLALFVAVHHPVRLSSSQRERPDAWVGNAVEVDAVATPDSRASVPSSAATAAQAEAAPSEPNTLPAVPAPVTKSDGERAAPVPVPPRPRPIRVARPVVENPGSATAPPIGSSGVSAPAAGAFGGEDLPPGVRGLPSAFTRAIPPATAADPIWQTLPTGTQHPFTIAVEVDADGHIRSAEILKEKDGSAPEMQATHVRQRVVALLGGGLFALQNDVGAGHVLFRITITLSDRPVHDEDEPAQLVEHGFEPPLAGAPGRAYFTLASGRHFEGKVQVLPRQ